MTRHDERIELPLGSEDTLRGLLSFTDQVAPTAILYVHGLGGHRGGEKAAALQAECARRDWTLLAFDFRGHGESSGRTRDMKGSRLLEELVTIQTFAKERGVEKIHLMGSSMGGWAAAWFAHLYGEMVQKVVLLAPAFQFLSRRWDQLPKAFLDFWKAKGVFHLKNDWIDIELGYGLLEERDQFPAEELTQKWNKPTLIFHGLADNIVPWGDSRDFLEKTPRNEVELRLFKGGDHRLTAFKDEIAREACRFFEG